MGYEYDELQRLTRAASTAGPIWTRTFSYDGFGNLTGGVTDGVGWVQGVNAANNRLTGSTYDGSGNPVNATPFTRWFDFENRLSYDEYTTTWYEYDHGGKRYKKTTGMPPNSVVKEYYFYGIEGKLLATCAPGGGCGHNLYFGGKLTRSKDQAVVTDRLGSVRWHATAGRSNYYPYGEERTTTGDGA